MGKQAMDNGGRRRRTVNPLGSEDIDSADETTEDDEDFDPAEYSDGDDGDGDLTKETTDHDETADTPEVDVVEEKKRSDRLWSDFLSGVEKISKKKKSETEAGTTTVKKVYDFAGERVEVEEKIPVAKTNGAASAKVSSNIQSDCSESSCSSSSSSINTPRVTNSNMPSTSTSLSSSSSPSSSSSQLNNTSTPTPGPPRRAGISFLSGNPAQIGLATKPGTKRIGGLSAVLNALHSNKKQKISTIEKTRLDWQSFKKEEGIDEELKKATKSKDGFIERQEFLQRADLRQFEIEKNLRARARRNP